jgi:hypothetical protein
MNVKISWIAPTSNYQAITSYKVVIKNTAGTLYYEDLTNCNGALNGIVSQLYCEIPMTTLRASPYSLTLQ